MVDPLLALELIGIYSLPKNLRYSANSNYRSQETFDLIQFMNAPPWSFAPDSKVTLLGAHGSEVVRSFCFLDSVSYLMHLVWVLAKISQHKTVLTCGEDGRIKAWRDE
jgi:WD repeat-containing protein 89